MPGPVDVRGLRTADHSRDLRLEMGNSSESCMGLSNGIEFAFSSFPFSGDRMKGWYGGCSLYLSRSRLDIDWFAVPASSGGIGCPRLSRILHTGQSKVGL
jgi:hypothetical protein